MLSAAELRFVLEQLRESGRWVGVLAPYAGAG